MQKQQHMVIVMYTKSSGRQKAASDEATKNGKDKNTASDEATEKRQRQKHSGNQTTNSAGGGRFPAKKWSTPAFMKLLCCCPLPFSTLPTANEDSQKDASTLSFQATGHTHVSRQKRERDEHIDRNCMCKQTGRQTDRPADTHACMYPASLLEARSH